MRLLAIDIETEPNLVYTFSLWKTTIGLSQIVRPGGIMCFAAQWYDTTTGEVEPMKFFSTWGSGKEAMVSALYHLLDEADAILTYNGDSFDIPIINGEFAQMRLGRPSPFATIDLYKVNKKHFRFPSKKLDYLSGVMLADHKVSTGGFELWKQCMEGDVGAQVLMEEYCKKDVALLPELYLELLPWITNHPNLNLFDGHSNHCPTCGKDSLTKQGIRHLKVGSYQRFKCSECGSWSGSGKNLRLSDVRGI